MKWDIPVHLEFTVWKDFFINSNHKIPNKLFLLFQMLFFLQGVSCRLVLQHRRDHKNAIILQNNKTPFILTDASAHGSMARDEKAPQRMRLQVV